MFPKKKENHKEEQQPAAAASIDKRKAEALLDNMKEDPSRSLRYQLQGKRRGPGSGKDW